MASSFLATLAESFRDTRHGYEPVGRRLELDCRRVHRRRRRVRPLHGPVLGAARAADGRLRGSASGQRVVDVGCGPGALTTELVRRVGADGVSAVDPSEPFVAAAKERHPGVDVRLASAEQLPFGDDEFDRALAQLVVHFMADPVKGLRGDATRDAARRRRDGMRLGSRRRHGAGEPVLGSRARARRRRRRTSPRWPARAKAISRSCSSRRAWATSRRRRSPSPSSTRASTRGGSRSRRRRPGGRLPGEPRPGAAGAFARALSSTVRRMGLEPHGARLGGARRGVGTRSADMSADLVPVVAQSVVRIGFELAVTSTGSPFSVPWTVYGRRTCRSARRRHGPSLRTARTPARPEPPPGCR